MVDFDWKTLQQKESILMCCHNYTKQAYCSADECIDSKVLLLLKEGYPTYGGRGCQGLESARVHDNLG